MDRRSLLKLPAAGLLSLPALGEAVQSAVSSYRRPKLKITDIRTAEVSAHGYQLHVRVYTDQGIFGQGEGTDAFHGGVRLTGFFRLWFSGILQRHFR